ncbi:MAG: hypothetical protein AAB283_03935 [Planctomycetota bacterium]
MKLKGIILIAILFVSTNVFAKNFLEVKQQGDFDVTFEEKTYSVSDNMQIITIKEGIVENLMPLIWFSAVDSDVNLFGGYVNLSVLGEKIIAFTESDGHPVLAMIRAGVTTEKQLVLILEVAINSGDITIGEIHIAGNYFLLKPTKLNR